MILVSYFLKPMNYKQVSDLELWEYCRHNDMRAYNELFDRYVGKLHRMGLRYVKDNFAVEELASDILFNLWVRRHELIIETSLSAYLFQAMHFKAISHLRKNAVTNLDIESLPEDILVSDGTADQQVVLKDMQDLYGEKLEQLSPQRQKVFRLSREQQLSYNDIAQEMKLSANTVRNHMNAALEYLRQHLPNSLMFDLLLLLPLFS